MIKSKKLTNDFITLNVFANLIEQQLKTKSKVQLEKQLRITHKTVTRYQNQPHKLFEGKLTIEQLKTLIAPIQEPVAINRLIDQVAINRLIDQVDTKFNIKSETLNFAKFSQSVLLLDLLNEFKDAKQVDFQLINETNQFVNQIINSILNELNNRKLNQQPFKKSKRLTQTHRFALNRIVNGFETDQDQQFKIIKQLTLAEISTILTNRQLKNQLLIKNQQLKTLFNQYQTRKSHCNLSQLANKLGYKNRQVFHQQLKYKRSILELITLNDYYRWNLIQALPGVYFKNRQANKFNIIQTEITVKQALFNTKSQLSRFCKNTNYINQLLKQKDL